MARYAKASLRAKAKSDDLSLSPKATSKNFFVYFLHLQGVSFSRTYARTHALSRSLAHSLLPFSPKPACRRSRRIDQIGRRYRSVIVLAPTQKDISASKSNPEINRIQRRGSITNKSRWSLPVKVNSARLGENSAIFAAVRLNIGRHSGRSSIVEDSGSLREITRDV